MKAGFLFVSVSLVVAIVQAKYDLSCAKSELSIRWPSYESNSEYYVCSRLFGRKMTVNCNPGEVFTFVLQSCTSPNRYIPAPAAENLPTAAPLTSEPNKDGFLTPIVIPDHPPVLRPPTGNMPILDRPAIGPPTLPPLAVVEDNKPQGEPIPENGVAIIEEEDKVTPPLPPTPAPTPPVVVKPVKKPGGKPAGKKPAVQKPAVQKPAVKKPAVKKPTDKNQKSTTSNKKISGKATSKKPNAAAGKKTTAPKSGKGHAKADKTPKKIGKKPNAKDKKTPKEN